MPPIDGLHDIWPKRLDAVGEQQRAAAQAGAGERRLGPGVASADDNYIIFFNELHHIRLRAQVAL